MNFKEVLIIPNKRNSFAMLPLLFLESPDGPRFSQLDLFDDNNPLLLLKPGSTISINADEHGSPILFENDESVYYTMSDGTHLNTFRPFCPFLGNVGRYYEKYCVPSVVESVPEN